MRGLLLPLVRALHGIHDAALGIREVEAALLIELLQGGEGAGVLVLDLLVGFDEQLAPFLLHGDGALLLGNHLAQQLVFLRQRGVDHGASRLHFEVGFQVVEPFGELGDAAAVAHVLVVDAAHLLAQALGLTARLAELLRQYGLFVAAARGLRLQRGDAFLRLLELAVEREVLVEQRLGFLGAVELYNGAQLLVFGLEGVALARHTLQFLLRLGQRGFQLGHLGFGLLPRRF